MAELHTIASDLRRQRKDLDELLETTSSRSAETTELLAKIEDLRRRAEETQRRYDERLPGRTLK